MQVDYKILLASYLGLRDVKIKMLKAGVGKMVKPGETSIGPKDKLEDMIKRFWENFPLMITAYREQIVNMAFSHDVLTDTGWTEIL